MISFLRKKDEKKPISFTSLQMKKSPKNYKRWIIFAILLALALFSLYINKYQQLVNESSYLADQHCIKVNPLIIDRKKKYLEEWNLMLASASASQVQDAFNKYLQASEAYLKEEKAWLPLQKKYLESKAFNLLIPSYIKEASNYQFQMYEAEYNSSLFITQGFKETDRIKQLELSNKVLEETAKSKEAGDKYNSIWEREKGRSNWIYHFVKVPPAQCPVENYNIPELPDPFAPPIIPISPLS